MFNKRVGRKRALSIYSILTIIVLISISEVRASEEEQGNYKIREDASVLVSADLIKIPEEGEFMLGYLRVDNKIRESLACRCTVKWEWGGESDASSRDGSFAFVEIPPGNWAIGYTVTAHFALGLGIEPKVYRIIPPYTESIRQEQTAIEPRSVYVLINIVKVKGRSSYLEHSIERAPHSYEYKTGYATHPTNSKCSFKVK